MKRRLEESGPDPCQEMLTGGHYTIRNSLHDCELDVEVEMSKRADAAVLMKCMDGGYVRIKDNGWADLSGQGLDWCHLALSQHGDAGQMLIQRGELRLVSMSNGRISAVQAGDAVNDSELWTATRKPPIRFVSLLRSDCVFGPYRCEHVDLETVRLRASNGTCLRIREHGQVDEYGQGTGDWAKLRVERLDSGSVRIRNSATPQMSLGIADGGELSGFDTLSADDLIFTWQEHESDAFPIMLEAASDGSLRFGPFFHERSCSGHHVFRTTGGKYLRMFDGRGDVDVKGSRRDRDSKCCRWTLIPDATDPSILQLRNAAGKLLGCSQIGRLTGRPVPDERTQFKMVEAAADCERREGDLCFGSSTCDDSVHLTFDDRQRFIQDGFLHFEDAVSALLVEDARAVINKGMLSPGFVQESGELRFPTGYNDEAIRALLFGSKLWTLVQRLLGKDCVERPSSFQLALVAPNRSEAPLDDASLPPRCWHVDGMRRDKPDQHSPFSLLVGVALSDQAKPNVGNLIVWPGSHRVLHPLVRERVETGRDLSIFSGDEVGANAQKPELFGGRHMLLKAGDAVVLHDKVAHRVGLNLSADIRYQVYFRINHVQHHERLKDRTLLNNLFGAFDGLQSNVNVSTQPAGESEDPQETEEP